MDLVSKGRKIIISIIVVLLLFDIAVIAITSSLYAAHGLYDYASFKLMQGLFRFTLEVIILFFLYRGHRWAKWLLIVLLAAAGLFSLISLISDFDLIVLIIGLMFIFIVAVLIFSESVKEFLYYQREERENITLE
jgi:hypothetical protein